MKIYHIYIPGKNNISGETQILDKDILVLNSTKYLTESCLVNLSF